MRKIATASAIAALTMGAGQAGAADFSYHYVDAGLKFVDAGPVDGKGLGIAGSSPLSQVHPNVVLFGGLDYLDIENDQYLMNLEGGIGVHWPLAPVVDFTAGAAFEYLKARGDSDLGMGINAGIRARPFDPAWELFGGLKYIDAGAYDDTRLSLGARYSFQPGVSAGVELISGDYDIWSLSVRWEL